MEKLGILAIQDTSYPQKFKKFVSKFEASKNSKFSKTSLCSKSIYMGNEPEKNLKEKKNKYNKNQIQLNLNTNSEFDK